ncbi:hypothetical protein KY334_07750, partial [Candidatus Woesearchaeota archaeon]|nr:hypothetical protein [Candidatus Woesearchaeota archaeon]
MNSKINKAYQKKLSRRDEEFDLISNMDINLSTPLPCKKPKEFAFDRYKLESYSMPIGINNNVLEKKSDGFRVHLFVNQEKELLDKVRIYSSDMNEWDFRCFP